MVTEEVKRTLLDHARVDAVVLVEPNKPKRALMNIEPEPTMPTFNLKEQGALQLIWDALAAMANDGPRYIRVGGESMRLPNAMVWIVADELPMRIAMYGYASRILVLSIIIALFTAFLLYLALRWLVILPLQDLSADMIAFRRAPEEPGTERPPTRRRDEIGVVDREFQNLQRELRASLRQKSRLAEVGAATNKINHDLRNMLSTARLLSDRLARSDDERTRALAPTILNTIDRAARLASDAIEYVRDRPTPRLATSRSRRPGRRSGRGPAGAGRGQQSQHRARLDQRGRPRPAGARRPRPALSRVRQSRPQCLRGRRHRGDRAGARQRRPTCWSTSATTAPACRRSWPPRSSARSSPAAAPAARASASPSPAIWCARMAATSPSPRPASSGTTFRFTLPLLSSLHLADRRERQSQLAPSAAR